MEKIINLLIKEFIEGVDTYTHNGSTWLIFTESKQWVIELTESKTLWYNYNFFKEIFEYTSMDVVENQHYITKWVEDNIINKVSDIHFRDARDRKQQFEDTLENGVKETKYNQSHQEPKFKEVLKNGVKHTEIGWYQYNNIDDAIENGVKETNHVDVMKFFDNKMDDAIENGVKETKLGAPDNRDYFINEAIQNGIKETNHIKNNVRETKQFEEHLIGTIDEVIKNGVKETKTPGKDGDILSTVEWMNENNSSSYTKMINDVLDNGVKKISPLDPEFSVRFIDGDENNDWEKVPNINEVIDNGVKETKYANRYDSIGPVFKEGKIENVIENGDKVSGTFVGGKRQKEDVESVIGYGTKNPTY